MNLGGAPQRFRTGFRQSQRAYFAGRNQSGHGADGFLNRNVRIHTMLIEEIDRFDAEPLKTGVAGAPNIFRRTIDASNAIGIASEQELGGNDNTIAGYFAKKTAK